MVCVKVMRRVEGTRWLALARVARNVMLARVTTYQRRKKKDEFENGWLPSSICGVEKKGRLTLVTTGGNDMTTCGKKVKGSVR